MNNPKNNEYPCIDLWLKEAKASGDSSKNGMYLIHNGTVRETSRECVRNGAKNTLPVTGMEFTYNREALNTAVEQTRCAHGIHYVRVWLNEGLLNVGDDLMYVLVGGDTRTNTVNAMQALLERIKTTCVTESEKTD